MRILYRVLLFVVRITFGVVYPTVVRGRELIPEGAAVICANHSSAADPLILLLAMDLKSMPCFMAKKELLQVPLLGSFIKAFNVFGVDRGHGDTGAMTHAEEKIKEGNKIIIFPQGTRVRPGEYARPKSGAVRIAVACSAEVLPVYVPEKKRVFGRNLVVIGEPYRIDAMPGEAGKLHAESEKLVDRIFALGESTGQMRLCAKTESEARA